MTAVVNPGLQRALRRAAVAATRAPSLVDTQPWRFVVRRDSIEIHADRSRQLARLDPDGRGLLFSCGSALTNVVLSLAADGLGVRVARFPDPHRLDLVAIAHIDPDRSTDGDALSAALRVAVVDRVRTSPPRVFGRSVQVVRAPSVVPVARPMRAQVEALVRESVDRVRSDPSARAEIQDTWLTAAPPAESDVADVASIGVVVAAGDSPQHWARAGENYQAAALDYALAGVSVVPVASATAFPDLRDKFRSVLGTVGTVQLLFRTCTGLAGSPRRRRRLVDTLVEGA